MDASRINYLAVGVAALSSFLLGGLWYSPVLFAKVWIREAGIKEEELGKGIGRTFGAAFVLSVVIALNLAFFLGPKAGVAWGATAGALAGVGWAAASLGIVFLFERRSFTLILIDGGYTAIAYTLMGTILGAWPG